MKKLLCLALALFLLPIYQAVRAAEEHRHHAPYAGQERRAVKALSDSQVAELKSGAGMALSLAAELNHHPGPRHALELADALGLSPAQRRKAEELIAAMSAESRALGEKILAIETELDRRFAHGHADEAAIRKLSAESAVLWGELRAVHLLAHRAMTLELNAEQIARYDRARGYGAK